MILRLKVRNNNERDVGNEHAHACSVSQSTVKLCFKRDRWLWWRFVPNLFEYVRANNYFTAKRFDEVIARIKWCSFFAPQCIIMPGLCLFVCLSTVSNFTLKTTDRIFMKILPQMTTVIWTRKSLFNFGSQPNPNEARIRTWFSVMGNNSAVKLCVAWGFRLWRIMMWPHFVTWPEVTTLHRLLSMIFLTIAVAKVIASINCTQYK